MQLNKKNFFLKNNTHQPMLYFPWLIGAILGGSLVALLINYSVYQFPGNNYFPPNAPVIAFILFLIYLGLILYFGTKGKATYYGLELLYFFGTMSLVALATNAVQLTPFPTIDHYLLAIESHFIDIPSLINWTNQHFIFKQILLWMYASLPYQMSIIPLIIIAFGRFSLMREYYFLLLITTLLGFTFYYFFPTTAPASVIDSHLFLPEQLATGFKFHQIHHHMEPTTLEGGLIAFPSFHVIWALLCIYLVKEWPVIFGCLVILNGLLIASCVLLGWHYFTDIIGGLIVVASGYYFLYRAKIMALSRIEDPKVALI